MPSFPGALLNNNQVRSVVPSGALAWYDTSSSIYLTLASTAITQFLDRTGNGNHTSVQSTGALRPTFTSNQCGGLPAAVFNGANSLSLPANLITALGSSAVTMFALVSTSASDTSQQRVICVTDGLNARLQLEYVASASKVGFNCSTAPANEATVGGATKGAFNVLIGTRLGTAQTIQTNTGLSSSNSNGVDIAWTVGTIGAFPTGASFLTGVICEILIYNRALSAAEITQVNLYLANKWDIYYPNAGWISAMPYPYNQALYQTIINSWTLNKDNAFTNTALNPIAAIWDPSVAATGSTPSLADTGRGVNTATEATNPPVNTANAIGTANGLLYNATTTILTVTAASSINDIFAAGGCAIDVTYPLGAGASALGCIWNKAQADESQRTQVGSTIGIRISQTFSVTAGIWDSTNPIITYNAANIIAVTYDSSSVLNKPTMYLNSLAAKAVTITTPPVGTASTDAASNLVLGNLAAANRCFNGYFGKRVRFKSIPTTAQLTAIFNTLATEYGVTLT